MPIERELKLTVHGDAPEFSRLTDLAGFSLGPVELRQQSDTYFDTRDGALRAAGFGLRIREIENGAGESLVTLKGPNTGADGVHSRIELECTIPKGAAIGDVQDAAILEKLLPLASLDQLEPVARIETERSVWQLASAGELSLDRTKVVDRKGKQIASFSEIEFEHGADTTPSTVESIRAAIEQICAVRPSLQNKLERALAAASGKGGIQANMPWREAAQRMLQSELERLLAYLPMAAAGLDPEGVHGARVSVRRLRAAVRMLRDMLPRRGDGLLKELRWFGAVLGPVRDSDVMIPALAERAARAGLDPETLEPVIHRMKRDARRARERMEKALVSRRAARLLDRLHRLVHQTLMHPGPRAAQGLTTRDGAAQAIRRAYRRMQRDAEAALAPEASIELLHELRKTAKRVRYTLEFLAPAFRRAEDAVSHLKDVQEHLGGINDASVMLTQLRAFASRARKAKTSFALGVLVGSLEAELRAERVAFEKSWKKYDPRAERRRLIE